MEDEIILTRPSDRRLVGEDSDLTPGPPGVESDSFDLVQKGKTSSQEKKSRRSPPSHNRRSPAIRNRRSTSRGRKSKSRTRETPTYGREYSPPRRYGGPVRRRSRERILRSPDRTRKRSRERIERRRDRRERSRSPDRYRARRSRSQSVSPRSRRWSPKKKPASPPPPPPINPANPYAIPGYSDAYATYPTQYPQQYSADYGPAPPPPAAFSSSYPPPPTWGMVVPLGDDYTAPGGWPAAPVPPPAPSVVETDEEQMKRDAAVAQEVQNQRDQLKKQRNDYLKRASGLKREMKILKEQRNDLVSGGAPPSPTTKGFLEENDRLQSQIQKKLNTMENVIDMLSGIIGDEKPPTPPSPVAHKKVKKKKNESDDDSSPERLKTKVMESLKSKRGEGSKKEIMELPLKMEPKAVKEEIVVKKSEDTVKKINYTFYDPEMHWCQTCNVFPKTAKDYLNHLHSKEHSASVKNADAPWHEYLVNNEFPNYPNAPSKRAPIRGLQFFIPSTSWFCKLCNFWMGDLHCASAHLKSQTHSEKYNAYIDQNPHFEVDWMAERQKAYDMQRAPPPPPQITSVSTSGMDLLESIPLQINTQKKIEKIEKVEEPVEKISKKRKKKMEEKKEKKKKKRSKKRKKSSSSSSSSSSESSSDSESVKKSEEDRANSIRVAMRNLSRSQEQLNVLDGRGKWTTVQEGRLPEPVPPPPPTIVTAEAAEDRKKDELMISQWNTPQPIISESEKKLLEELKGKLKGKGPTEEKKKGAKGSEGSSKQISKDLKKMEKESPRSSRSRDLKEKEGRRSRSRNKKSPSVTAVEEREGERRSRSPDRGSRGRRRSPSKGRVKRSLSRGRTTRVRRSRSRDRRSRSRDRRSRSRGRRSRSRGGRGRSRSRDRRSRSRSRGGRRRRSRSVKRRSRSYGRRRSYSRSRSRSSSHRIEKPIVRYPEFRPRVPENKKVTKMKADDETERKKTPPTKKASANPLIGKKLPFIGRMPVFKKQNQGGDDKKDGENADPNQMEMHMGYDHFDGMMMDYDDLMPDPMQYVTLMGAPPPPPPAGGPPEYADEKDMLPPGVDETEADLVPKPISDAPIPRKGPLPKDFQEALNIIFPGEKKPEEEETAEESKEDAAPEDPEIELPKEPEVILPDSVAAEDVPLVPHVPHVQPATTVDDETSQMSIGEAFIGFPPANISDHSQEVPDQLLLVSAIPPPPPPPPPEEKEESDEKASDDSPRENNEKKENSPTPSEKLRRQEELDDLAMLGIDADDLAAQCM